MAGSKWISAHCVGGVDHSLLTSNPALARYVRPIWEESLGRIIKSERHYYVKRKSEFLFFGSNWLYRQVVDQSADNGQWKDLIVI